MVDYTPAKDSKGRFFYKSLIIILLQIKIYYTLSDWRYEPKLSLANLLFFRR